MPSSKHVLLVDDEKRIREVVEYALVKAGYRVTPLAEGEPVLGLLAEDAPDLIVLDSRCPALMASSSAGASARAGTRRFCSCLRGPTRSIASSVWSSVATTTWSNRSRRESWSRA